MPKKPAQSNCKSCNIEFNTENKNKKHSKGLCRACYTHEWYIQKTGGIEPAQDKGHCIKCNSKWNEIKKKRSNREYKTQQATKQLCRSCYSKQYKIKGIICKVCGGELMIKTAKKVCEDCFTPKKELIKMNKEREKIEKLPIIDSEKIELMRLLFVRYKWGTYTSIDHYRVVDLYIDIVTNENPTAKSYDGLEYQSQILMMLKSLKKVYDKATANNKNLVETPQSKEKE